MILKLQFVYKMMTHITSLVSPLAPVFKLTLNAFAVVTSTLIIVNDFTSIKKNQVNFDRKTLTCICLITNK